jgi:hypothetical protein
MIIDDITPPFPSSKHQHFLKHFFFNGQKKWTKMATDLLISNIKSPLLLDDNGHKDGSNRSTLTSLHIKAQDGIVAIDVGSELQYDDEELLFSEIWQQCEASLYTTANIVRWSNISFFETLMCLTLLSPRNPTQQHVQEYYIKGFVALVFFITLANIIVTLQIENIRWVEALGCIGGAVGLLSMLGLWLKFRKDLKCNRLSKLYELIGTSPEVELSTISSNGGGGRSSSNVSNRHTFIRQITIVTCVLISIAIIATLANAINPDQGD